MATTNATNTLQLDQLQQQWSYADFRAKLDELMANGQTTGDNHSEAMLHYTELNIARMRRLDKRPRLTDVAIAAAQAIDRPMKWLTITEGWCGDAAQIVPIIDQLAQQNNLIEHTLVLRDENLVLMDQFLTNGARAIPITIFLDATTQQVLGSWGPRPDEAQELVMTAKAAAQVATDEGERKQIWDTAKVDSQKWYARDKGVGIQEEFILALQNAVG